MLSISRFHPRSTNRARETPDREGEQSLRRGNQGKREFPDIQDRRLANNAPHLIHLFSIADFKGSIQGFFRNECSTSHIVVTHVTTDSIQFTRRLRHRPDHGRRFCWKTLSPWNARIDSPQHSSRFEETGHMSWMSRHRSLNPITQCVPKVETPLICGS